MHKYAYAQTLTCTNIHTHTHTLSLSLSLSFLLSLCPLRKTLPRSLSLSPAQLSLSLFHSHDRPFSVEDRASAFNLIELICVVYFTAELVVRFLSKPSSRSFFLNFMTWVDIASILPFYVLLAMESDGKGTAAVRVLRLFRVLRLLKLGRFSRSLQV